MGGASALFIVVHLWVQEGGWVGLSHDHHVTCACVCVCVACVWAMLALTLMAGSSFPLFLSEI